MNKKNKSKNKSSSNISRKKLIKIFLIIFLITLVTSALSYFVINKNNLNEINNNPTDTSANTDIETKDTPSLNENKEADIKEFDETTKSHEKFEEYTQEFDKDIIEKEDIEKQDIENKTNEEVLKKVEEIKEDKKKETHTPPKEEKKENVKVTPKIEDKNIVTKKDTFSYNKKDKPKIAILIDDVSTQAQKEKILNIGYTINMAFLPPTSAHKDSARIVQNLPFHMIHFPMQASSAFKGEEINTLKITDSYETIERRVKQLREWYPNAIYTNNHTGSVFTENDEAMDRLFRALKKYNFIFVDSRTSAKSVAKKYAAKYDMPYIVRNTFIDNERDYKSIQNQLKKAIEIAKKQGYAIAIGHPHNVTLQVLKDSKHLLEDVEPIFINKLPYL